VFVFVGVTVCLTTDVGLVVLVVGVVGVFVVTVGVFVVGVVVSVGFVVTGFVVTVGFVMDVGFVLTVGFVIDVGFVLTVGFVVVLVNTGLLIDVPEPEVVPLIGGLLMGVVPAGMTVVEPRNGVFVPSRSGLALLKLLITLLNGARSNPLASGICLLDVRFFRIAMFIPFSPVKLSPQY
jgi:hypothetical protein